MRPAMSYVLYFFLGVLISESGEAAQPNSAEVHINACRAVVDAANRGALETLAIQEPGLEKVDINNDGKLERVEFSQESLWVFGGDGQIIELVRSGENDWDSDNLQSATDFSLINYGNQIYILGKTDVQLRYLAHVDGKNVEKVVCEFGYRKNPVETLFKSSNDKLCQAVLSQSLDYAKFDRLHALSVDNVRASGFDYYRQMSKLAAYVDINNDGEKEYVVGLGFIPVTGWSCEAGHLWVLNKARNRQDVAITQQLPEWVCGSVEQAPFIFEGQVYLKAKGASDQPPMHRVVQLKQGRLDEVCQFSVRAAYFLRGEYEDILESAKSAHIDPWIYALDMAGTSGLQAMMDAKHDLRIVSGDRFSTVVHQAIIQYKLDALRFLLEHGADPNAKSNMFDRNARDTPLIFAIHASSTDAVRLLLKNGANPTELWAGQPLTYWVNLWVHSETDKALMLKLLSKR